MFASAYWTRFDRKLWSDPGSWNLDRNMHVNMHVI